MPSQGVVSPCTELRQDSCVLEKWNIQDVFLTGQRPAYTSIGSQKILSPICCLQQVSLYTAYSIHIWYPLTVLCSCPCVAMALFLLPWHPLYCHGTRRSVYGQVRSVLPARVCNVLSRTGYLGNRFPSSWHVFGRFSAQLAQLSLPPLATCSEVAPAAVAGLCPWPRTRCASLGHVASCH